MRSAAFLYPWDVVGDPDAPRRIADLGVQQVTLASAYHSTRALTPRHPRTRVVTARHSAVLYPPDPEHWRGRELRPYAQGWMAAEDPFGEAARALAEAGLDVHSWVVLAHNSRLGEDFPQVTVENAHGDRYPWAPCIARPEVREYAVALAAEAAARPGARGTELESCGWYGFAHLHAHDKTAGVGLGAAGGYLMSLCFCSACRAGYASLGADGEQLRRAVLAALGPLWRGERTPPGSGGEEERAEEERAEEERAEIRELLGAEPAGVFAAWRSTAASRLQREAVAAVRARADAAFRVLLHADPAPHRVGANVGVEPAEVLEHADGVVLPCGGGESARRAVLAPFGATRPRVAPVANFPVVSGMGGSPASLAEDAAHARELGAGEIRLYHAGLASGQDLSAVRTALARLG